MTPYTTPGHSTRQWLPVASALPLPHRWGGLTASADPKRPRLPFVCARPGFAIFLVARGPNDDDETGSDRPLAQPDCRLGRGGARPVGGQSPQLADPSRPPARRTPRVAHRGRLGAADPRQSPERARRGWPRPGRGGAVAPRADRPGSLRRPID